LSPAVSPIGRANRIVEARESGLENRFGPLGPTRVQIPPPPLNKAQARMKAGLRSTTDHSRPEVREPLRTPRRRVLVRRCPLGTRAERTRAETLWAPDRVRSEPLTSALERPNPRGSGATVESAEWLSPKPSGRPLRRPERPNSRGLAVREDRVPPDPPRCVGRTTMVRRS
jgi:hypothetical protein